MKDALALLRVLENPFDEVSWFRVLQLPEGVGPATARRLMDELGVRRVDDDQPSPLLRFLEEPVAVPKAARERGAGAASGARATAWPTRRRMPPAAQLERLRRVPRAGVRAAVRRRRRPAARPRAAGAARGRLRDARPVRLASSRSIRPSSTGDLAGPPLLDEDYARPVHDPLGEGTASGTSCT